MWPSICTAFSISTCSLLNGRKISVGQVMRADFPSWHGSLWPWGCMATPLKATRLVQSTSMFHDGTAYSYKRTPALQWAVRLLNVTIVVCIDTRAADAKLLSSVVLFVVLCFVLCCPLLDFVPDISLDSFDRSVVRKSCRMCGFMKPLQQNLQKFMNAPLQDTTSLRHCATFFLTAETC